MNGEWLRLGMGGVVPVTWDLTAKADTGGGPGELEGWASVYNVVDQQDDIVLPGAFSQTIKHMVQSGRVVPLSKDHDFTTDAVIGSVRAATDTPYGLKIRAGFASTPDAQAHRTKAKEGHLAGLSIFGPIVKKSYETRAGKEIRLLHEVGLMQVALTAYPANLDSLLTAAKSVMAVHHTPVVDEAWDASAAVTASNTEAEHRHMFAILRANGDPALKASYALPHHKPGVNGPAVVSAVRNALARLPQTQGLSDAERAAAKAHLQAHLDDYNAGKALDPQWEDDLRAALRISSAPVRAVAVESLMKARYPDTITLDPPADADTSTGGDVLDTSTTDDDAARYALSIIGESGAATTPPGGEANPSLVDLEAIAAAEVTSAELTALEADLRAG
jgi:Escherichia/Staphylococcus phage prohead protease